MFSISQPLNGTPFDEPDEDKEVAAIAQRFEAKYVSNNSYHLTNALCNALLHLVEYLPCFVK